MRTLSIRLVVLLALGLLASGCALVEPNKFAASLETTPNRPAVSCTQDFSRG